MSTNSTQRGTGRSKTARLTVRLSAKSKERIRLAASMEGVSMSAFALSHAYEAAQHVIERETRVELGEKASLQVAEVLARPARALPELVDLFRE